MLNCDVFLIGTYIWKRVGSVQEATPVTNLSMASHFWPKVDAADVLCSGNSLACAFDRTMWTEWSTNMVHGSWLSFFLFSVSFCFFRLVSMSNSSLLSMSIFVTISCPNFVVFILLCGISS